MPAKKNFLLPPKIHPAIMAVWAAAIAGAHCLPTIPLTGIGSSFSVANTLFPLSGILFGPVAGALCSAAGAFIGNILAPHTAWMGLITFIIGTTTSFTAGCIAWGSWPMITIDRRGNFIFNGGIIIYLMGTLLWFSQEIGRSFIYLPIICYGAGFAALIAGCLFSGKILTGKNEFLKFPVMWFGAFGGMFGGATVGNFFTLIKTHLPKETWILLVPQSILERAIFSAGTVLIGVPLLMGLRKIGIFAGPQAEEESSLPPPPEKI